MTYAVKEIFYSVQGEGANTGRPAVFCRFSGCNLWSGRADEQVAAVCSFCDTDFFGTDGCNGGYYETDDRLVATIRRVWAQPFHDGAKPFVVCTGGEPTLQLNEQLVRVMRDVGFEVAIETNGTMPTPSGVDWICVSPKAGTRLRQRSGNELKLVFPQTGADPELYASLDFDYFFLQPMYGLHLVRNVELALHYCLIHPQWRLSLQTQKVFGDPSNEPSLLSLMTRDPPEDPALRAVAQANHLAQDTCYLKERRPHPLGHR